MHIIRELSCYYMVFGVNDACRWIGIGIGAKSASVPIYAVSFHVPSLLSLTVSRQNYLRRQSEEL